MASSLSCPLLEEVVDKPVWFEAPVPDALLRKDTLQTIMSFLTTRELWNATRVDTFWSGVARTSRLWHALYDNKYYRRQLVKSLYNCSISSIVTDEVELELYPAGRKRRGYSYYEDKKRSTFHIWKRTEYEKKQIEYAVPRSRCFEQYYGSFSICVAYICLLLFVIFAGTYHLSTALIPVMVAMFFLTALFGITSWMTTYFLPSGISFGILSKNKVVTFSTFASIIAYDTFIALAYSRSKGYIQWRWLYTFIPCMVGAIFLMGALFYFCSCSGKRSNAEKLVFGFYGTSVVLWITLYIALLVHRADGIDIQIPVNNTAVREFLFDLTVGLLELSLLLVSGPAFFTFRHDLRDSPRCTKFVIVFWGYILVLLLGTFHALVRMMEVGVLKLSYGLCLVPFIVAWGMFPFFVTYVIISLVDVWAVRYSF